MQISSRATRIWVCFALMLALAGGGARAQDPAAEPYADCDYGISKGDLCGHALAAIARMESAPSAPSAESLLAQPDTDVTHCFLDLELDFDSKIIKPGSSNTLYVTSRVDGLTQMTVDLQSNMVVDAVTVNGNAATYTRPTNAILINLGATYNAGASFQVKVAYHGSPLDIPFFGSTHEFFGVHSGSDIASTLSQPYYGLYWWPCKENWGGTDTPMDDKFTMDMWITVPNTMIVAANGALQGTDTLSGGRRRYRWRENYPIATYLVAFAATNYDKRVYTYEYPGGSMPVEFYIYPESVSASLPFLDDVVTAIGVFSQYYGQYPFITEKYGIAQFPWCCGMEHQTLTSQGAYTSQRRNIHELAHQWWGDDVTCKTWHDIWLNEGLATFSYALWQERRPGGSYSAALQYLNSLDSSSTPIRSGTGTVYRYDISSSDAIFSTTYSYNKGAWVVHMLRHVLGDTAFCAALSAWRTAYTGSAGDTEDFRAMCELAAGLAPGSLSWFFDEWIYNPGVPYYRYGWEQEQIDGRHYVRLCVEQYQQTVRSSFPNAMKMPINITLTTGSGNRNQVIWNDATGGGSRVREWFLLPADGPVVNLEFDKYTWILRNTTSTMTYIDGPPKIVGTSPVMGSNSPASPGVSAVEVQFSEPVTCSASNFTVTGSSSGPQAFTFSYDAARYRAILSFADTLAGGQTFTVQVADAVRSQASGDKLDGEMADPSDPAMLPSGDGLPGGTATFTFNLFYSMDFNLDNHLDAKDILHFVSCMVGEGGGPLSAQCADADLDHDGDADQSDFGILQRCLTGPIVPFDPDCR